MRSLYFNEIDPYPAQWIRNLARAGVFGDCHVVVAAKDVRDVESWEVHGATRAHFFAGIGVWEYAIRLAGLEDVEGIWTASLPCQPFSVAGLRKGEDDDRHLWPTFRDLVAECLPPIVAGEQVASPDGRRWLANLRTEMEALGYRFGAADLCAAGVGAPHIRQRLFWGAVRVAGVGHPGLEGHAGDVPAAGLPDESGPRSPSRGDGGVGEPGRERLERLGLQLWEWRSGQDLPQAPGTGEGHGLGDVGAGRDADGVLRAQRESPFAGIEAWRITDRRFAPGCVRGFWEGADWLLCSDPSGVPRWRPVRPGSFPMAHGSAERVGRLRAYGNAIVAPLAAEFLAAFCEVVLDEWEEVGRG